MVELISGIQTIVINRSRSLAVKLSCGVPQGSVLGPILFILYTKDISAIIKHHGPWSYCYANDTHVYFYCISDEVDSLAQKFVACSDKLCAWMWSNRLKLNADKTVHLDDNEAATVNVYSTKSDSRRIRYCTNQWRT